MELPAGAPLKDKIQAERNKLREMTFKKKLEYIWDYYKFPIIGFFVVLIFIGSLLNIRYFNPPPGTALFVAWSAGFATEEQLDDLKNILGERIIDEAENEEVSISLFLESEVNPAFSSANAQRLVAMVAAGEIDVFITDKQLLEEFSENGILMPLDHMLAEIKERNPTVHSRIEENITYALYRAENGSTTERITGIQIGSSPLLTELDFFEQELFFCISVTSGKHENNILALITLFE